MSWSISGADNLAKILAEKCTNRLFETVDKIYKNIIPEPVLTEVIREIPLTASKVNKKIKPSNVYKVKSASIPYSNAAVSLGRKVIRNLCGLKEINDISYN